MGTSRSNCSTQRRRREGSNRPATRSGAVRSPRSGRYSARGSQGSAQRSGRSAKSEVRDWIRNGLAGYGADLASEIAKASASLQVSKDENDAFDLTLSRLQHGMAPNSNYAYAFE